MTSAILTAPDLVAVTGRRQHAAQIRWLRKQGLSPLVSATGVPIVTWDAVTALNLGKPKESPRIDLRAISRAA